MLMTLFSVGQVWAADETYTFTSKAWAATNSASQAANWTSGQDGSQMQSGRGVQITAAASGANATSPASLANISKIVVTYSTNANNGAGSISLQVGSNTAQSQNVTKTGGTADRTLEYNYATAETGSIKLTVTCTTNSIYVKSVTVTYGSGEEPGGGGTSASADVTLSGGTFADSKITWTIADGNITISQLKGTSSTAVNSSYISAPRVYKGHILSFEATNGYKISSISIKCDGTNIGNSMTAGTAISNNTVTDNTTAVSRTWATASGGTHVVSSVSEAGLSAIHIQNVATTNVQLRPTKITITYIAPSSGKNPAGLAYSTADYKIKKGASFTAPELTNPNGLTVNYSSNNASAVEVNATSGAITIHTVGKAVITASSEATDQYEAGSASYTVYVFDHEGTAADPYSVADARRAIDWNYGITNVYAAGKVSEIVDAYSSQYHNISYNFSTDGTTTADQLEAFRGKGKDGANFTSENDVLIGDEVVVYGSLTKYGSTYEFAADNQLYSRKTKAALSWDGVTANAFAAELNGQNTFPTLVNTNNVSPITYSSDNPDVVEVISNEGVPTLKATGTTLITASFAGNENYLANSVSYTLNVSETILTGDITYECNGANSGCPESGLTDQTNLPENLPAVAKDGFNFGGWYKTSTFEETSKVEGGEVITEDVTLYAKWEEPYTVAQARAAIDAGVGVTGVYAKGIVSEIVTAYNSQYGNISYNISADGLTTSDQLQAYRGFNKDGEWFTSADDVQVGDEVVIYGNLKKHNSTYEFDANNQRYSFNRPAPKYTVRFWNSEGWDNVYAFVWDDTQAYEGDWPGLNITSQIEGGWHYYQIEEGRNIIFTAGFDGPQTIDINDVQANACYILGEGTDELGHKNVVVDNDCDDRLYVAGNPELTGESWNTTADRLVNGSITFTNVPAGSHEFKITNGTWKWNVGAGAFDSENSNVENWGTDNVGFSTNAAKDITIAYDKVNNKITVTAVDYVEPVYKAIVVSYGGKYYAMTKTAGNNGFAPLEVTVDGGNVIVPSAADSISIMWKFNEGTGTATFQDGENKYLAHTGTGTDLTLQAANTENPEVWTWDNDNSCYYVVVTKDNKTTNRTFCYRGGTYNIFKNYAVSGLGVDEYSGAPTFYAPNQVKVSKTVKVRFFAPVAWENVKAHTWGGKDDGDHQMTAVEEGSRWFEGTIEKGVDFLFYNGTWNGLNQTDDQTAINEDKCFAWSGVATSGKYAVTEITSCEMNYSIAGEEALTGVAEWGHTALVNNTITYNEVAVGTYKFKITNGTWDWNLGAAYVDADACQGVTIETTDEPGNVVFSLASESNVTITYNPATEKISIVASAATPKEYYTKVTSTDDITAGTYLIVYEGANKAFNGGLTTLDAVSNTIDVTISEGKIEVSDQTDDAAFFIDPEIGTIKSASGKYIGVLSNSNGLKQSEKIYTYKNAFSIDDNGNAVIAAVFDGANMTMRYNSGSGQNRFRYFGSGQQPIQLYKKAEVAKANPQLTFDQTAVEAIKGDDFTAPALSNNHDVTVSYESSATGKATVNAETGEVTLNNAGEVTIYAVSAGNDEFRESYAKYTITISAYETVRSGLTPGRYYTVCYDKTMKEIKGASLWSFNGKDANMAYIVEENLASYPAGTPYLIYAESDKLEAITEAVDNPTAGSNNGLYGTLTEMSNTDLQTAGATHLLINNELRPLGNGYLIANRAYVILGEIPNTTPSNAPGKRVRAIPMHQDAATGIDELNASEKPVKMVIDGQLYILRGEKMYDATGRLVK